MKKGISAVIAIVLILMITVALAAMAYVFFTSVFNQISQGAAERVSGTEKAAGTQFVIEGANWKSTANVTAYVRNTGTIDIDLSKMAAYISDVNQHATFSGTLSPGDVATLNFDNTTEACDKVLKLTAETGYTATRTISCP